MIELSVPHEAFKTLRDVAVGMRVMMLENSSGLKYGMTGKVVGFDKDSYVGYVGVEFDKGFEGGHDCSGKGKSHHCWWIWYEYLGEVR